MEDVGDSRWKMTAIAEELLEMYLVKVLFD